MRIAVYWEQDSWGGVDSHLLELLSTWPDRADEFVLFYSRGNRGFERIQAELSRLPFVRSVPVSSWHQQAAAEWRRFGAGVLVRAALHLLQPMLFLLAAARLRRVFESAAPFDVLLADNGGYPASWGCLSALLAARRAGIAVRILLVHHAATRPGPFMGWFESAVDRGVSGSASAIVCVSHATRQSLLDNRAIDTHLVRLRVIHNTVTASDGAAAPPVPDLRKAGEPGERLVVIVGRVEPYKGHDDVIFALARLPAASRARLRLLVIGDGEESEVRRLQSAASRLGVGDRVTFLGYVTGRSIDLIAQVDLLIVATRGFEGFGLTAVEAMHAGTPVLVTRAGGVPEVVDETTGVLINAGAPGEIAAALEDFLASPEAWRARAARARQQLRQAGQPMAPEYHALFKECHAAQ